jgi:hypothetical protein
MAQLLQVAIRLSASQSSRVRDCSYIEILLRALIRLPTYLSSGLQVVYMRDDRSCRSCPRQSAVIYAQHQSKNAPRYCSVARSGISTKHILRRSVVWLAKASGSPLGTSKHPRIVRNIRQERRYRFCIMVAVSVSKLTQPRCNLTANQATPSQCCNHNQTFCIGNKLTCARSRPKAN